MEKDLQKVLKIISNAPDSFLDQLSKTEQEVYKKILGVVKDLDVDSGNVKASIANLKKLNEIKTQLSKTLLSKEYIFSVKEYIRQFQVIANLQNQSFNSNKPISKVVTDTAIDNTLETLTGKGYTDTVVNRLRDVIRTSVTTGGSYKDLTVNLENLIVGDERQSLIKKQVQAPVVDALSIFSAEHTKLITADLNYEWFIYVGSNKTTTREFCEHLTEKKYVHVSEIPDIVTGLIDGHQCKLGKDGLPLGMFEDTDANNFQVNRGGYNCGHQLYPISKEQVPLQLRMMFEKNIESESSNDNNSNPEMIANNKEIASKLNINKGEDMTFDEANEQRGNIHYSKGYQYKVNCQSCVVANELRRRGFDVTAQPNLQKEGDIPTKLSRKTELAWIDPKTDKKPEKQKAGGRDGIDKKGSLKSKPISVLTKELNQLTSEVGRYHIDFAWKIGISGHIITAEKLEDGKIRLYDPQNGKMVLWSELSKQISLIHGVNVLRVDNLLANIDIIDGVVAKQ